MANEDQQSGSAYRAGVEPVSGVVVTTGNDVAGFRISQYLGIVRGIVVRAASLGQGLVGAWKQISGGNIDEYTQVCEAARHEAYVQMIVHAEHLGAHAIIGMRYDANEFTQGATEVLAYGTAVRLERS
jgi:uncharacterized protein YbjQ (UPF0145 family)